MGEHRLRAETGMARDRGKILQHRFSRGIELEQLVVGAARYAMGRGQDEIARERRAGA